MAATEVNDHTIESHNDDGDQIRFIDYGKYGITVETRYSHVTFDAGLAPGDIPALIEWLQATQANQAA